MKNKPQKSENKPVFNSSKEFLSKCNPDALNRLLHAKKINNPVSCLEYNADSLTKTKVKYGESTVIEFLTLQIISADMFFSNDNKKKMLGHQIKETAELISMEYFYYNLAEVSLIFRKIKIGEFGEVYGNLNGNFILKAFMKYRQMRLKALEEISKRQNQITFVNQSKTAVPMPNSFKESVRKLVDKMNSKNKKDV